MDNVLKFLPEFILWGSALYFWGLTAIFLILLFLADIKENGYYAFVYFLVFAFITRQWGTFDVIEIATWELVSLYFGIGLVHSLIRTYFFGRKEKGYVETDADKLDGINREVEYRKGKLKGNVFRWWFLWPVSLTTWVFSDLLKDVYNFVYDKLSKLYENVLELGLKKASKS
jgi:hypothetical protein